MIVTDLAAVLLAGGATGCALGDLDRAPRRLWRLGVPPLLALPASLLTHANALDNVSLHLSWLSLAAVGWTLGAPRGRCIAVETDQVWGTVRTARSGDAAAAAALLLVVAALDALASWLSPGVAAALPALRLGGAVAAGYLGGRAWTLVLGAARTSHTALGVADAPVSGGD